MPVLKLENFQGALENANPRLIPDNMGATARNVDFSQGRLEAGYLLEPMSAAALISDPLPSTVPGCAEYIIDSPVVNDIHERLYFLCGGKLSLSTPTKTYRYVGVPVPTGQVFEAEVDNAHLYNNVTKNVDFFATDLGNTPADLASRTFDEVFGIPEPTDPGFKASLIDYAIASNAINPRSASHVEIASITQISDSNENRWYVTTQWQQPAYSDAQQLEHKASHAVSFATLKERGLISLNGCGEALVEPSQNTIVTNAEYAFVGIDGKNNMSNYGFHPVPATNVDLQDSILSSWDEHVVVQTTSSNAEDLKGPQYRAVFEYPEYDSNLIAQERFYAFSYVTDMGEEGPLVPAQVVGDKKIFDGSHVTFSAQANNAVYGGGVYTLRVYRAYDGEWRYVDDVPLVNQGGGVYKATGTDTLYDYELGEVAPNMDWDIPPDNAKGLTRHSSGALCLWKENDLFFSVPYLPHAWPTSNRLSLDDNIVSVHQTKNGLLVLTDGPVYMISGSQPSTVQPTKVDPYAPNVYEKSAVDMGDFVVYLSNEGLVKTDGYTVAPFARVALPKNMFRRTESGDAIRFDEHYVALIDKEIHVVSRNETVIKVDTTDFDPFGFDKYRRYDDSIRVFVDDGADRLLNRNSTYASFFWKSKRFRISAVRSLSSIKIVAGTTIASGGEIRVTVRGFVGHKESYLSVIESRLGDRDPLFFDGARLEAGIFDEFEVEVYAPFGSGLQIDAIILGNSMAEVRNA